MLSFYHAQNRISRRTPCITDRPFSTPTSTIRWIWTPPPSSPCWTQPARKKPTSPSSPTGTGSAAHRRPWPSRPCTRSASPSSASWTPVSTTGAGRIWARARRNTQPRCCGPAATGSSCWRASLSCAGPCPSRTLTQTAGTPSGPGARRSRFPFCGTSTTRKTSGTPKRCPPGLPVLGAAGASGRHSGALSPGRHRSHPGHRDV